MYEIKGQVIASANDFYIVKTSETSYFILESSSELDVYDILYLDNDTVGHVDFIAESLGNDFELDGIIQWEDLGSFDECSKILVLTHS